MNPDRTSASPTVHLSLGLFSHGIGSRADDDRWMRGCSRFAGIALVLIAGWLFIPHAVAQNLAGPPKPDELGPQARPLPTLSEKDAAAAVVARVNGTPIFQNDVQRAVNELTQTQKIPPESLPMVQAAILQKLVERDLVQQFLTQQKLQAGEAEINAALEKLRTELQLKNLSLEDFLTRTHQTEATVRTSLANDINWNKFVAQQTNDKTLQQFFDHFHEQFDGTERRVSHILLRPDGKADQEAVKALVVQANQLHDQITSGVISFEDAAEKYSAGPSRSRGGDLGFIPIKGVMLEPFSQAAFALKQGDVSEPVVTGFGVHLIKVTDVKPGKKTWQEVRDQLQPALANFLRASLTKQLSEKSTVQYAAGVPHFKKGTTQLEVSESAPGS